jgi:ABC-type glycerol-3-phosphate transport system substrate-binding protein
MKLPKFFSVVLTAFMFSALFAGCNKETALTWKDLCFEAVTVAAPGTDFNNVIDAAYNGEKFIISAYTTIYPEDRNDFENRVQQNFLLTADEKNGVIKKTEYPESYNYLYAAKDGTVYGIQTISQNYVDANGRPYTSETYFVVTIDEDLNVTRVLDLGAAIGEFIPNLSYAYIADFKADKDGNIYLLGNNNAYGINTKTGNLFMNIKSTEVNGMMTGFVESPDNEMQIIMNEYTITSEGTKSAKVVAAINVEDGSTDGSIPLPTEDKTFFGGKKYPYYTYNTSYIYGIDGQTSEKTIVANLLESGSASLEIRDIVYASDDKFAVLASDVSTHQIGIYMLKKLDPKDVKDKTTLSVAALRTSFFADYYIKEFNRKSTEYKAELISYGTQGASYRERLAAFNLDFAAGNTPDVLIIDVNMDYHGYVSKNMFEDLYPLIDEDPDISREDLVQPVMKAHETNGKLYSISPNYSIETLIGKTEIFGEKKGQSLAELQAAAASHPEATLFSKYESASSVVMKFISHSLSDYVNYSTGECYFNTPEFIALLEAAKKYPVEAPYETYNPGGYVTSIANNKILLYEQSINDFREIVDIEHAIFDAPVTFLGYPSESGGSGSYIYPEDEVTILSDSENKAGAWEFVKGFMQYKGPQNTESNMYTKLLPAWQKHMDDFAADALDDPYYIDYQTGEKVYSSHATMVDGQILSLSHNTPEDNARMIELINSVNGVYRGDGDIFTIISEDADTFFRGQKSVEETAAMIENRVSTYLAERGF